MNTLLLCAALAFAQEPAQRPAGPRAPAARETVYVAVQGPPPVVTVQTPPPNVTVDAPSEWPTIVLGVIGAVLLWSQIRIMNRQTQIMDKQTALAEQQAAWRRDEAIGTFYRMAFDLVEEFKKANVGVFAPVTANYEAHPRQQLRQASALFAPLGNEVVMAVNAAGMQLDEYYEAVEGYNKSFVSRPIERREKLEPGDQERYNLVQSWRRSVGGHLDLANRQIPQDLRWKYTSGDEYQFQRDCAMPVALRTGA